jgi:putative transcriptional regulator
MFAIVFQRRYIYGMSSGMVKTRIEEALAERGRSLYWLAKESGVTYAALWNLKERRTDGITFTLLDAICKALDCQPGDILVRVEGDHIAQEPKRRAQPSAKRSSKGKT